jgi:hypothetical protein
MAQNIRIPEPKYTIALRVQPLFSLLIAPGFAVAGMLASVKFDDETMFMTHEVDDERAYRNLATKTQPV